MKVSRTRAAIAALALLTGLMATGAQPAHAAGCVGTAFEGWTYDYAYYTKYASVCGYLAVRAQQGVPGQGVQWTGYAYDYTVGDAYNDWNVKNWVQYKPALNSDGYSSL